MLYHLLIDELGDPYGFDIIFECESEDEAEEWCLNELKCYRQYTARLLDDEGNILMEFEDTYEG